MLLPVDMMRTLLVFMRSIISYGPFEPPFARVVKKVVGVAAPAVTLLTHSHRATVNDESPRHSASSGVQTDEIPVAKRTPVRPLVPAT